MVEWFLVPYTVVSMTPRPKRQCAMNDFNEQIFSEGGDWDEIEVDGDKAVVKVKASKATIDLISLKFSKTNKGQAQQLIDGGRRKPYFDKDNQQIKFESQTVPCSKRLEHLRIKEDA